MPTQAALEIGPQVAAVQLLKTCQGNGAIFRVDQLGPCRLGLGQVTQSAEAPPRRVQMPEKAAAVEDAGWIADKVYEPLIIGARVRLQGSV
jgi:hypothetical protein